MIGALIFNIIAVFFAWLESSGRYKHGLKLSLFTIFLFLSLRYDYGNDYMTYLERFLDINRDAHFNKDLFSIAGNEIGWLYLNRLFGPLGFFAMTAVLAAFTSFVLYRFIKKYVPIQYYWFAILLYVFQPNNMLVLSTAMRQAVAVSFFLLAIDYIIQKKIYHYLILIFFATLFHSSAAFLFPLVLLCYFNWQIKFIHIILSFVVFGFFTIFAKEFIKNIDLSTAIYFDQYNTYVENDDLNSKLGLGFILNIFIYAVVLLYARKEIYKNNNVFFNLTLFSFLLIPFGIGIQMIGRLNYYLLPVMMAIFPIVFIKLRKKEFRLFFISIVILFTLYQFFIFFNSEPWIKYFGTYHTIFSAPTFY